MLDDSTSESINMLQLGSLLKRNLVMVLISVCFTTLIALLLAIYLPHRFKSKAVLSIQSGYFQHPLVNDLISETQDPSEMSSQRLSLLRLALNDQFLDKLGTTYQIYKHPSDNNFRVLERESLFRQIEYFSVSPTSFQISISTDNPETSYKVTTEILDQMTSILVGQRYQTFMKARDSILKQAKLLESTLSSPAHAPQQDALRAELASMESNLASLRARFTEQHPDVMRMKSLTQALEAKLKLIPNTANQGTDDYTSVFLSPASRASTQQIFDDLLKKLSHLNIVLEMERNRQDVSYLAIIEQPTIPTKPTFPDPVQFVLIGALGGLLIGGAITTFRELRRTVKLTAEEVEEIFGLEFLGELPQYTQMQQLIAIGESKSNFAVLTLPARGN